MIDPALLRVLVDTSVWVSAFLNPAGPPARILRAFLQGRFVLITSSALLNEIDEVLNRPRIRRKLHGTDDDIALFMNTAADRAFHVVPAGTLRICRDPKDDILLETAIRGHAQYAVSRDDDWKRDLTLITHLRESGVEVVSVAQFLRVLDERAGH